MPLENIASTEQYIEQFGISPTEARAYIVKTFDCQPEELNEADFDDHEVSALIKIALSSGTRYLLEEVYAALKSKTIEREKIEAEPGRTYYWQILTAAQIAESRRQEFEEFSLLLKQTFS